VGFTTGTELKSTMAELLQHIGEESAERKEWRTMRQQPLSEEQRAAESTNRARLRAKAAEFLAKKSEQDRATMELAQKAASRDAAYAAERKKNIAEKKERKEAAFTRRLAYERRQEMNKKKAGFKELPPLLSKESGLSINQRMYAYGKNHYCIHTKRGVTRKEGSTLPRWKHNAVIMKPDGSIEPTCNHATSRFLGTEKDGNRCTACYTVLCDKYWSACNCEYFVCKGCGRSTFVYMNNERWQKQWYDRHIDKFGTVRMVVGVESKLGEEDALKIEEEVEGTDLEEWNRTRKLKEWKPAITKEKFFDALQGKSTWETPKVTDEVNVTSVADYPELTEAVKEEKKPGVKVTRINRKLAKLMDLRLVDTKEEGGAISTITSSITGASNKVTEGAKTVKNKLLQSLKDLKKKLADMSVGSVIGSYLKKAVNLIKYVIGVIYDIVVCIGPLQIYHLFVNRDNMMLSLIGLASAVLAWSKGKFNSLTMIEALLGDFKDEKKVTTGDVRKHVVTKHYYLGAMHTILMSRMKENPNMPIRRFVEDCSKEVGMYPGLFEAAISEKMSTYTTPQAGILDVLSNVFSDLPGKFASFVDPLNRMFKTYMPILMGVKVVNDLRGILVKMVTSLVDMIYGATLNNKLWIDKEISTEGSPIHDVVATYMEYNTHIYKIDGDNVNFTELRQRFYSQMTLADKYVLEQKRMGVEWLNFNRALQSLFTTPPEAKPREQEPVVLVLSGKAGSGKTTIWKALVAHSLKEKNPDIDMSNILSEIERRTHTWNQSTDFQVGMASKKIILFDDFQQDKQKFTEALSVISLCTTAPYPINTPAITGKEIKGMFSEPDTVVICTNAPMELVGENLMSTEALLRRIDLELAVKKRFNPHDRDAKIVTVTRCTLYKNLVGKDLSLQECRLLFSVVEDKKRSALRAVNEIMKAEMNTDLIGVILSGKVDEPKYGSDPLWQCDNDFMKDAHDYFERRRGQQMDEIIAKDAEREEMQTYPEGGLGFRESLARSALIGASLTGPFGMLLGISYAMRTLRECGVAMYRGMPLYATIKAAIKGFIKAACIAVSTVAVSWGVMKLFFTPTEEESGNTRTAKARRHEVTVPQSGTTMEPMDNLFMKATGGIRRNGASLNIIFVGGHFILVPRHFFLTKMGDVIDDGTEIDVIKSNWNGAHKTFLFERKNLVSIKGNIDSENSLVREDVCLYKLSPTMFSAEKNIVAHFWDGSYSLENFEVTKIDFVPWNLLGGYCGTFMKSTGNVHKDQLRTPRNYGNGETFYHVLGEASYASRDSSCGSIVRLDRMASPIVGIHVAASKHSSCFHYVTRQALEEAMRSTMVKDVDMTPVVVTQPEGQILEILPERSSLCYEGIVKYPVYLGSKTDLTPSTIYECDGPAVSGPAPLTYKDERIEPQFQTYTSFYKQLFAGYQTYAGRFSASDLNTAYLSLREDMTTLSVNSQVKMRTLNIQETLNGIAVPDNTRVDMSTSCGWPYVQQNYRKTDLIEIIDDQYIPGARLTADYLKAEQQIMEGTVPFLPFSLTVKDERIKLPKIKTPRSRLFACANIVHYMICRKYFYTRLMQVYHAKMGEVFCSPALDRLSLDWNRLICMMMEVGREGFDFDFSFWDRTMQHVLLYFGTKALLVGLKLPLMEEETIAEMMASPISIFGQHCFRSNGIMMSGMLLTFLLNCAINEMVHRAAWVHIMMTSLPAMVELRHYRTHTRRSRAGDDTITTVMRALLEFYNGVTVSNYFRSKGLQVTAANKSDEIVPYKDVMDLIYLKNQTGYARGLYIPLCDFSSLRESTYWIRLNKFNNHAVKATEDNTVCALRGMYFHGLEKFNDFREKALAADPRLVLPTYEELSIIWTNYYKFPGAHADYATRELQVSPISSALKAQEEINRAKKQRLEQISTMRIVETTPEVGALDKTKIEMADVERASPNAPMAPNDKSVVENNVDADINKTETKRVGATVQDSGSVNKMSITTGETAINSHNQRAENSLNDTDWDLSKLEHKFTFIKTVEWKITDPIEEILATLRIPQDIIVTPAQKAPFDVTRLWRCRQIRMKLVIKGSPFYAGSVGFGFTPFGLPPDPRKMINMGAMIQKVSQNDGFEFVIPFRYRAGFLDVTSGNVLGAFCIFVISRLTTGAGNPNNVPISIYAAIEDSQFKLPEPIPATRYFSHKFDSLKVRETEPQAGTGGGKKLVDINMPIQNLPFSVLAAGEGTLGKNEVENFQDMPNDFCQVLKRWKLASRVQVKLTAGEVGRLVYALTELYGNAMNGLDDMYAMYRGSIAVRVQVRSPSGRVQGRITHDIDDATETREGIQGFSYFNEEQIGQVTVPWMFGYFVDFTRATGEAAYPGYMITDIVSSVAETAEVEFHVCVADDFHMGVFCGTPTRPTVMAVNTDIPKYSTYKQKIDASFPVPTQLEEWDGVDELGRAPNLSDSVWKHLGMRSAPMKIDPMKLPIKKTVPQSGIVEFIDRALETTLPIAEKISKLGMLLDAHMITEQPHPMQLRAIPYSVAADLPQYTERLKTLNHNGMSLPDDECFGTKEKETDIHKLLTETKSWVANTTWKGTDVEGTPIFSIFNGPGVPSTKAGQLHDAIPPLFDFWTGGTIIICDVMATEMHRGQLLFVYNTFPEDINYADATQTYFTTYDLSEGRGTIALMLPYMSQEPFKRTVQVDDTKGRTNSTGKLTCFVQNSLRSTTTVASDVDVVIFKAYGKDFQLGVYGNMTSVIKT
jgi:hypothetical protein